MHRALSDDFNTPQAIAVLNELLSIVFREIQYNPKHMLTLLALRTLRTINYVFGLFEEKEVDRESELLLNGVMRVLIDVRKELRRRGIYDLADSIRSELLKLGVQLMDKGLETTWITVKKK
ncbi:MAG: DALR domain-containing protein [Desulfurococcaceae archaeon]